MTLSTETKMERIDATHYRVTVPTDVPRNWFYTKVTNPAGKYSKILSIKDETNNRPLDPANFWTSDYTMKDGIDPLLDYRLHIADIVSGKGTNTYIVEYEPIPEVRLDVESIKTVPGDEQIAEVPIEELTVTFNKDIDPATFTRDDIVVRYEGKTLNNELPISAQDETTKRVFKLNTSSLNENGYYVLQVKTDNITDTEGYQGAEGKMVRWMLFKDGLVHYNVDVYPLATYGNVECIEDEDPEALAAAKRGVLRTGAKTGNMSGSQKYGRGVTFKAMPNEGYKFAYWKDNATGEILSTDANYHVEARSTLDISAVFEANTYKVTVTCNEDGGTMDVASGLYEYGTQLTLDAKPNEGYRLDGYKVNGETIETSDPYELTVEGLTNIEVLFHDLTPVDIFLDERKDYKKPIDYVSTASLANGTNVKLYRSFLKGAWNTICLPCAIDDPEKVFGAGTEVARLVGMTPTSLTFEKVTKMEANIPYIIKPTVINNAAYANVASPTVLYDLGLQELMDYEGEHPTDTHDGVSFIGAYSVYNVPANEGYYYISGNKFYYMDVAVPTTRYRGYFHSERHNALMLSLGFGGESTNIENIYILPEGASDIYDLTGKKVRSEGESLEGLKPGVYITRNKKFVVK